MYKLFIYDNINMPTHDNTTEYINTIPFCSIGIEKNFILTQNPYNADFFYIGQYSEGKQINLKNYKYYTEGTIDHIADIEGDWFFSDVEEYILSNCLLTLNGCKNEYKKFIKNICIRPTFSKNLMNLLKKKQEFFPNLNKKFTFIGFNDPLNIRIQIKNIIEQQFPRHSDITMTDSWLGSSDDVHKHKIFNDKIKSGTFSLCPRGTGVDSVRFLESCYYGRIPIVISDNLCFGYDFSKPFFFQYDFKESINTFFDRIFNLSDREILDYSNNAFIFFDTIVRNYFKDPTQYFLRWLNDRNIK